MGTRIAPRFEWVSVSNVPVGQVRGFVSVHSVIDDGPHFREPFGELQVRRRRIHRVDAGDDEQVDLPCVHRSDELVQRPGAAHRGIDRSAIHHGRADVAKRLVHRLRKGMHGGGLVVPGDNKR